MLKRWFILGITFSVLVNIIYISGSYFPENVLFQFIGVIDMILMCLFFEALTLKKITEMPEGCSAIFYNYYNSFGIAESHHFMFNVALGFITNIVIGFFIGLIIVITVQLIKKLRKNYD